MITAEATWDEGMFADQPHNGVNPDCTFCNGEIDMTAIDNSWIWFVFKNAIHAAHSECMQQNVVGPAANSIEELLRGLGGPL